MWKQLKRYAIVIKGNVQNTGYRRKIEETERKIQLKGYVFKDTDNNVKIVCEGTQNSVDTFIKTIKDIARTDIESFEKQEIHDNIPLPNLFSGIYAVTTYLDKNRIAD